VRKKGFFFDVQKKKGDLYEEKVKAQVRQQRQCTEKKEGDS